MQTLRTHLFRAALIALCVVVATLFTRCGKPADDTITVKVLHWGGYMEQEWREKVIAPFEKAHPKIKIDLTIVPYGLYSQRLLAAAVSGAPVGDVLMVDDWLAVELISRGYAMRLDDRAAHDLTLTDFYPDLVAEWRGFGKGSLCGIPFSAGATVLFYNKNVFDRAHAAYPDSSWTYDDMARAAKAITADTNHDGRTDVWGMLSDNGGFTGLDTYLYANGGVELDSAKTHAACAEPRTVAALQRWVDLTRVDRVSPQPSSISVEHAQMFTSNRVGMLLIGDHFAKQFGASTARWDFALPPVGSAGRASRRFDDGFIIPASCAHPDAAWEFLKWVVTFPPRTGVTSIMEKSTPAYKPLATSPEWYAGVGDARGRRLNAILDRWSFSIIGPGWNEWRDNVFVSEVDNAFLGRKPVAQAMQDAAGHIDEVLQRRVQ